jgi:protein translocase SecG subunit
MALNILLIVLVVLIIIDCILIVLSILLQEDKSGGGIGILGGSSQSFFGASSGNMLAKITTILLVVFFLLAIVIAFVSSRNNSTITEQDIARTQTETVVGARKDLDKAPSKIITDVFEKEIIAKITNEADKKFVSGNYVMDSSNKFLSLKKDIKTEDDKRLTQILNSIKFSPESQSTVITTKDLSSDVTTDSNK